ncbi:glycosyltransferase family A protein [Paraclostridium bifermentans]|uniref:glycosyltransferase family A protein n=2 Tax=Paraclostridium TaxID=1849822 RepID=UPI00374F32C8
MKKKLIVTINFNTMDLSKNRLTKEWIDYRIDLFIKYTYFSLINQTYQDFLALIYYDINSQDLVLDALSKYPKLADNIIFRPMTSTIAFEQICEDDFVKESILGYDYLYLVPFDSDNLMHPEYLQKIIDFETKPDTQCIINRNVYIYDISTNTMLSFTTPDYHCGLYALIYDVNSYINGLRYKYADHGSVVHLTHEYLLHEYVMVLIHGTNILNSLSAYQGIPKTPEDLKSKALKDFNLI